MRSLRRTAPQAEACGHLDSLSAANLGEIIDARVVEVDGVRAAIGMLLRQSVSVVYRDLPEPKIEQRVWLHFDVLSDAARTASLLIVRAARDLLADVAGPVYALCDEQRYATAPRLLRLCGFTPTSETWGKDTIWLTLA